MPMLHKKIITALFVLISATIPFWMLANNIAIIITLTAVICFAITNKGSTKSWHPIYTSLGLLLVLMFLALLYTNNIDRGIKKIEHRLLFVIIPIICFLATSYITKKLVFKTIRFFVYATALCGLVFLLNAFIKTIHYASPNPFNEINGNFFSYMELTKIIENTHPIYYGTYLLFSIFVIGYDAIEQKGILNFRPWFTIVLFIYLTTVLFLLNSFLLSILFFLFGLYFSFLISKKIKPKTQILMPLAILTLLSISLSSFFVIDKFNGVNLKEDFTSRNFVGNKFTAVKARVAKFYCSLDLISNNFWIGVSPGDENEVLEYYYQKNNFNHGKIRHYNSHNQYLTEFIYTGVFGFLTLLAVFFILFKQARKTDNKLLAAIGFIYLCFNLTESALVRNKGIVFFVFFTCLLINIDFKSDSKLKEPT